jgi:DNA-binding NarL/FixJ family response regulator
MPGVLVVDDHPTARRTIRSLLAGHHICVCGEAVDGEEALAKVRKLRPDIVLLDINMPVNGIQVAYGVRRIAPFTKLIFLTIHDAPETAAVLRPLADGFITKSALGTELIREVERLFQIQRSEAGRH